MLYTVRNNHPDFPLGDVFLEYTDPELIEKIVKLCQLMGEITQVQLKHWIYRIIIVLICTIACLAHIIGAYYEVAAAQAGKPIASDLTQPLIIARFAR